MTHHHHLCHHRLPAAVLHPGAAPAPVPPVLPVLSHPAAQVQALVHQLHLAALPPAALVAQARAAHPDHPAALAAHLAAGPTAPPANLPVQVAAYLANGPTGPYPTVNMMSTTCTQRRCGRWHLAVYLLTTCQSQSCRMLR